MTRIRKSKPWTLLGEPHRRIAARRTGVAQACMVLALVCNLLMAAGCRASCARPDVSIVGPNAMSQLPEPWMARWLWDGRGCVQVMVGACLGSDCDELYEDFAECQAKHAHCER
jgi:hypothetical protein